MVSVRAIRGRCVRAVLLVCSRMPVTALFAGLAIAWMAAALTATGHTPTGHTPTTPTATMTTPARATVASAVAVVDLVADVHRLEDHRVAPARGGDDGSGSGGAGDLCAGGPACGGSGQSVGGLSTEIRSGHSGGSRIAEVSGRSADSSGSGGPTDWMSGSLGLPGGHPSASGGQAAQTSSGISSAGSPGGGLLDEVGGLVSNIVRAVAGTGAARAATGGQPSPAGQPTGHQVHDGRDPDVTDTADHAASGGVGTGGARVWAPLGPATSDGAHPGGGARPATSNAAGMAGDAVDLAGEMTGGVSGLATHGLHAGSEAGQLPPMAGDGVAGIARRTRAGPAQLTDQMIALAGGGMLSQATHTSAAVLSAATSEDPASGLGGMAGMLRGRELSTSGGGSPTSGGGSGGGPSGPSGGGGGHAARSGELLDQTPGDGSAAASGHRNRMSWLNAAHGDSGGADSGSGDDPDGAPASSGVVGAHSPSAQPTDTGGTGTGMAVPTSDGHTLTITPTSGGGNSSVRPDLPNSRYLITADNPSAPNTYRFKLGMPAGGRAVQNRDGGVEVINPNGQRTQTIAAPWATDATGAPVPTSFTVHGHTLTQHIAPGPDSVYPILADPAAKGGGGAGGSSGASGGSTSSGGSAGGGGGGGKSSSSTSSDGHSDSSGGSSPGGSHGRSPNSDAHSDSGGGSTSPGGSHGRSPNSDAHSGSGGDSHPTPGDTSPGGASSAGRPSPTATPSDAPSGGHPAGPGHPGQGQDTSAQGGQSRDDPGTPMNNGGHLATPVSETGTGTGQRPPGTAAGSRTDAPPGPDDHPTPTRPQVVIDAHGNNFSCRNCSGDHLDLGPNPSPHPTGHTQTYTGQDQDIQVLNPGPLVSVHGRGNQISGGDGNFTVHASGGNNHAQFGNGDHTTVTANGGDNNTIILGHGRHARAETGGSHSSATVGDGEHATAITDAGDDNTAVAGNGRYARAWAGKGAHNQAQVGDGEYAQAVTGAGHDNLSAAGDGVHARAWAGTGHDNTAMVGDGPDGQAVTGAGDHNLTFAGAGRAITGGPGNNNLAVTGAPDHGYAQVGEGDHNTAIAGPGPGPGNLTRTGPGNHNSTHTGPGGLTQVGSGIGNTANGHPVPPSRYEPFTPGGEVQPNLSPLKNHPDQPGLAGGPGSDDQSWWKPLASSKFWVGAGTNLVKNFERGRGTFDSAAKRHEARAIAASKVGDYQTAIREQRLQQGYQGLSNRLKELTQQKQPLRSVPQWMQKGLAQSIFDHINRYGDPGQHPLQNAIPALRKATFGGDNLKELARRGLTKVGGVVTVIATGVDLATKDPSESWGHAIIRNGASIGASAAAGGLAQAAAAAGAVALGVTPAGWVIGAGIGAGLVASYFMSKYDVADKAADGASWLGGKIADGLNSVPGGGSRGRPRAAAARADPPGTTAYA